MIKKFIKNYFNETLDLMNSVSVSAYDSSDDLFQGIEKSCQLIKLTAKNGNKLIFIGNGGSAAIASHMAVDFWKNGKIRAISFNDGSLLTCLGNDCGYEAVFEKPTEMFAEAGDLLFAISSSGQSKNILNGTSMAKSKGCKIITLSGFNPDNPLRLIGDINFYVNSKNYGPVEVIHQFICHYILDIHLGSMEGVVGVGYEL